MSKFLTLSLFLFLFTFFLSVSIATHASSTTDYVQSECLKVPVSQFVGSLKTTLDIIQDVTSIISNFGNFFGDRRLTNAITDCLDLLDFSVDELSWTMSASQNPKGKHNSTGDLSSDLRTWLSAALVNQGTCIEGFDGTSNILKGLVAGGLNQISSSVQELLNNVDPRTNSKSNGSGFSGSKSGNGAWLGRRVKWPGYHILNDSTQASNFTVAQFIEGNLWLPSTGVRYTAGLDV
ncbi:unnamed protein product [Dovyalis caffra]|uniref:Pectinesterase inhibitor domain-containing protein n=1 Tax=Dovyalis caffra TaxID=77055 RepID=A0AAV1SLW8_9ROSI|nr:unnamed protein product [Dovyalis caffra]